MLREKAKDKVCEYRSEKVVIVSDTIPPYFSGSGLRAWKHANKLMEDGRLAFVCTGKKNDSLENPHKIEIFCYDVELGRAFVGFRGRVQRFINGWKKIGFWVRIFCARSDQFNIIHCFGIGYTAFLCVILSRLFGKRSVVELTVLPDAVKRNGMRLFMHPGTLLKAITLKLCSDPIAISPALAKYMVRIGLSRRHIALIANGTNIHRFCRVAENQRQDLRESLGFCANEKIILFVGAFTHRKGVDILFKTFQKLLSDNKNLRLLVVGAKDDGVQLERRLNLCSSLEKDGHDFSNVKFVGVVNNVERYMQVADVMLFPTRREGFANVIIEAMACGLVVVTRYIEGITDFIIQDGIDGVLVDSEDPECYFKEVKRILDSEKIRNALSVAAERKVQCAFSEETIWNQYFKIYDKSENVVAEQVERER